MSQSIDESKLAELDPQWESKRDAELAARWLGSVDEAREVQMQWQWHSRTIRPYKFGQSVHGAKMVELYNAWELPYHLQQMRRIADEYRHAQWDGEDPVDKVLAVNQRNYAADIDRWLALATPIVCVRSWALGMATNGDVLVSSDGPIGRNELQAT